MPYPSEPTQPSPAQAEAITTIATRAPRLDQEDFFGVPWQTLPCFDIEIIPEQGFALILRATNPARADLFAYVLPEHRRQGLFTRLISSLEHRGPASLALSARSSSRHPQSANALTSQGFEAGKVDLEMAGPLTKRPETDFGPAITFQLYQGGDQKLDGQIAALENRLYGQRTTDSLITAEIVTRRFARGSYVMLLARDQSGALIGQIEGLTEPPCCTRLGVIRAHWGTGLAQELTTRLINHMVHLCFERTVSVVAETNHASLSLCRAFGMEIIGRITTYHKTPP